MLKISSVPFGVLTANSLLPSGDMATGRTCPLSNSRNEGPLEAADTCLFSRVANMNAHTLATIHTVMTHAVALIFRGTARRMAEAPFFSHSVLPEPQWSASLGQD